MVILSNSFGLAKIFLELHVEIGGLTLSFLIVTRLKLLIGRGSTLDIGVYFRPT